MTAGARRWPELPERFPPAFQQLLHTLLARPAALAGAADLRQHRARRTVLSQSGTFVGHRPYARGDDLRRVDWAAYARSGELFTKQLEEEERRTVTLLLDLSSSLMVGTPPRRLGALRLAAIVGGQALVHLDGLTVIAPGAGDLAVATFTGAGSLGGLLRHLDALPVADTGPEAAVALVLQRNLPGRVHWISDFAPPQAAESPLFALRRRGAKVTGWLPELASDHEPPTSGWLRAVDPETGDELVVPVDTAFAAELRQQLAALARQQDHMFAAAGSALRRWRAPAADDFRVAAWQVIAGWFAR